MCHRAIKTMCELIGIKDLYAKIEGSTNVQCIVKGFILGLLRQVICQLNKIISPSHLSNEFFIQKSHELLAEEKQLYLVEQSEDNYPVVIAAPSRCRTEKEIPYDESLDFSQVFCRMCCILSLQLLFILNFGSDRV